MRALVVRARWIFRRTLEGRAACCEHPRRDADRRRTAWNVRCDHGIGSDLGMRTNLATAENFRTRANFDVAADLGQPSLVARADGYLRKDQAVHAYPGARMNDDAIWVRNEQSTADVAIERDIGAGHGAPEVVPQHQPFAGELC